VEKFLYNGGEGKKIPITELVKLRNKDREKSIKISKDKQKKTNEMTNFDINTHPGDDSSIERAQGMSSLQLLVT
jgi:hypothetical protein